MKRPSTPPQIPTIVSIGQLAKLIGRHEVTLRRWYRVGALPKPFGAGKLQWLKADLLEAGLLPAENISHQIR